MSTVFPSAEPELWRPRHNQWAIAMTVTLATFMEIMDSSVANVSLPHIAGTLGADENQATWVITSYLVANAIILPLSSYLSSLMGRKRFYMTCVALFAGSSLLCGLAPTLPLLLFFRVLQGIGGGGLAPSEQSILADTFLPKDRGKAFALYGMAVVFSPTIGPTLGGYITDHFTWRWIFFINVPVAIVSLMLSHRLVEDPPHVTREVKEARQHGFRIDYMGFGLVALAFGCLEVVMDKGQQDDWFGSHFITLFTVICAVSLVALIAWELLQVKRRERPILDLRLFLNRTFATSFGMMFALGLALYGTTILLPQFLQLLLGYTAEQAGMALSAGGLVTMMSMPIVALLIGKVDARWLVAFGFSILAVATYHMSHINLAISFRYALELRAFQALGLAFLFVPINTVSYTGMRPEQNNDVSGLMNLARNVGGSIGTSIFTTMLARGEQRHQNYLAAHARADRALLQQRVHAFGSALAHRGMPAADAPHLARAQIFHALQVQAGLLSYIDVLRFFAMVSLLLVPSVLLMRKPEGHGMMGH
jgi:MFS transporter, DHA2 family, multidrug resistance protein